MKIYATLTLIGKDKSGVIARVTQFLFQNQANIEGLEEQVSRGEFSMTLQASWDKKGFDRTGVERGLKALAKDLGMDINIHFSQPKAQMRMGVLVTKETHVFDALIEGCRSKKLKADPVVVISNRKDLQPLAKKAGLPFHFVNYSNRAAAEKKVLQLAEKYELDFMVLARFMKILSPNFVWRWKNRIINIHPSLLPAFPGASAYRQAYEKGVKVVGVTAHFVTPDLDQGPIISQECFKLKGNEPLREIVQKGQACESKCLVRAVSKFLKNRLDVHWGKVYED
ncbi:MAG: formyltetrahydrofolate deformylase [Verrucomicrobiota bacterium]